ncbi:hypothetical protein AK812_SmicGene21259 [Symbiodinium microadriaticum]|uniref:Uncharacterized protein n=1 Tax=Symbiodinium microadriaticum TaxID=2951 RepID=A0A1Q9DMT8_SYMMI|nr:hypothetical protein AK812_SmicGene21259 [Symbiodinium microadriaticum]
MARNKKQEIAQLRRELAGERLVPLTRLAGDSGTDDGERRHQLVWQNFRIKDCTTANAMVLGTEHPDFIEGFDAAAANTVELFETMELVPAGAAGVPLDRLASVHGHYFGSGFEKTVGKKLRQFCIERFEYDDRMRRVKASNKVIAAIRKVEARDLIQEERDAAKKAKFDALQGFFSPDAQRSGRWFEYDDRMRRVKASNKVIAAIRKVEARDLIQEERDAAKKAKFDALQDYLPVKPPPFALAAPQVAFDQEHRPRYATTKMTPDELEERPMSAKGLGKGDYF